MSQAAQISNSDEQNEKPFQFHKNESQTNQNDSNQSKKQQTQSSEQSQFFDDNEQGQDQQKIKVQQIPILNTQQKWLHSGIGFLQCRWIDYNRQIKAISFGTAFAIDFDLIVTCAHNVFSQKLRTVCDYVQFVPFKKKLQKDNLQENVYKSSYKFIKLDSLGFFQKYSQKPLEKDIAVIKLDKFLPFYQLIKFTTRQIKNDDKIELMGYPKSRVKNIGKNQLQFQRIDLKGQIMQIKSHILVHNMNTQSGHSGSPILCYSKINQEWRYEICGIHSHSGPGQYNRGIIFTAQMREKIDKWVEQLRSKQNG